MHPAWIYQSNWMLVRLPIAAIAAAVIAWMWLFFYPMPPDRLTITTAGKGGAYYRLAIQYQDYFKSHGVDLEVKASEGSQENLEQLTNAKAPADLALMQGGFGYLGAGLRKRDRSQIETLANVNTEAIWLFSRNRAITSIDQLKGLKVAVGAERSGSRKVALKLFEQAKIDTKDLKLFPTQGLESAPALRQGVVDVVFMVAPAESFTVQEMLKIPGIQVGNLQKLAAMVERNPFLETSLLAQGAFDFRIPPKDTAMLTMSTSLVARENLNPALKRLAIAATLEINNKGGLFHRAGDFPTLRRIDFPTAPQARSALTNGLRWHESVLPFWWGQFFERVVLLVLPVVLLALWLMQRAISSMRWMLLGRVNRWYGELKFIENDLGNVNITGLDITRFLSRLNRIDADVLAFRCPAELMARTYTLHQHIEFVRQRLYRMRGR